VREGAGNSPNYPPGTDLTGGDLSLAMLEQAHRRAYRLGKAVRLLQLDAEALPFPDRSFDTVLTSLSLCTVPDPIKALRAMARVCRANGVVLLLEHVRSDQPLLAWLQDQLTPASVRRIGCHLNRETASNIRAAGLAVEDVERHLWGVIQLIRARPQ